MATEELPREQVVRKAESEGYLTRDFIFICMAAFCFVLSNNIVNPAIPLFIVKLGGSGGEIGIILAFRTFAALVTRPFAGALVDRGHMLALLAFGGLNSIISGGSYIFVNMLWLVGGLQGFKGFGLSIFSTAAATAVAEIAPPRRRGEAVGIFSVMGPVAAAFGPAIGFALLAQMGFTPLFVVSACLGFISLVLAVQIKPPKRERSPSAPLKFYNKESLLPAGALVCTTFVTAPVFAFIPIYFAQKNVGDPGPFFTIYAVAMSAMRLFAGKASDRHGRVAVFVPSVLVMALASLYLSTSPGYFGLLAAGVFIGGGLGAAYPALMALAIDRANLTERGSAMATIGAAFDGGLTLGTLADGFILEWGGFPAMFAANAVVPTIGVIGFLLLNRRRRGRGELTDTPAGVG